jgi:hypothetical protein
LIEVDVALRKRFPVHTGDPLMTVVKSRYFHVGERVETWAYSRGDRAWVWGREEEAPVDEALKSWTWPPVERLAR